MLTRRMFGSLIPAIPLAAQTIAEEVGARLSSGLMPSGVANMAKSFHPADNALMDSGSETDWLKDRLAKQLKYLAEIDKPESRELWQRQWQGIEARRIDSLRSVSPGAKARMMTEWTESLQRREHRTYIEREIDELKKQLGPLALLL